jgi:hypothetical protein
VLNFSSITNSARNFLFSRANREFLIFLCFLALASVFWLMMRLNETYEEEVKVLVRYTNVPKNAVITSGDTDTLRFTIRDKGFYVLPLVYRGNRPIVIDYLRYADKGTSGVGIVPNSDLLKLMAANLPASSKILSMKPETFRFYYNNGVSKRVPVVWHGNVIPQQDWFIVKYRIDPDTVTVYASQEKLDSTTAIYTEELDYSNFRDTLNITATLTTMPDVKVVPNRVSICFVTDMLTEADIPDVPIEGINMPEGKVLRTFPSRIRVHIVTGAKNYQMLSADNFRVVADYQEFSKSPSPKCNIKVENLPKGVTRVALEVNQVDYLIEEKAR